MTIAVDLGRKATKQTKLAAIIYFQGAIDGINLVTNVNQKFNSRTLMAQMPL